jgi:hypothetical protein
MGTKLIKLQPGSDIDSWCGKCKLMLAHTIEAMVGDKPARVHCNTCKSQHSYKPNPPEEGSRPGRKRAESESSDRQTPRKRVSRYQSLLSANNAASVKIYSPKDKYETGDVLEHPTFGRGITTAVKDATKIEVLFESGSKTLVYGK